MADKPILFSAPMIRALLDGRKTQTRRVLKPQPNMLNGGKPLNNGRGSYSTGKGWKPYHYAPGDRLWCREAWRTEVDYYNDLKPSEMGGEETILYDADEDWNLNKTVGLKRNLLFMPRWASRLTLTVSDVRVQRVQDISEDDCFGEGIERLRYPERGEWGWPQEKFRDLWNSINENRGFGWEANPWVIALTFEVHKCNIDQLHQSAGMHRPAVAGGSDPDTAVTRD